MFWYSSVREINFSQQTIGNNALRCEKLNKICLHSNIFPNESTIFGKLSTLSQKHKP